MNTTNLLLGQGTRLSPRAFWKSRRRTWHFTSMKQSQASPHHLLVIAWFTSCWPWAALLWWHIFGVLEPLDSTASFLFTLGQPQRGGNGYDWATVSLLKRWEPLLSLFPQTTSISWGSGRKKTYKQTKKHNNIFHMVKKKVMLHVIELENKTMNTHTAVWHPEGLVTSKAHFLSKDQWTSGHLSCYTFSVVLFLLCNT